MESNDEAGNKDNVLNLCVQIHLSSWKGGLRHRLIDEELLVAFYLHAFLVVTWDSDGAFVRLFVNRSRYLILKNSRRKTSCTIFINPERDMNFKQLSTIRYRLILFFLMRLQTKARVLTISRESFNENIVG